MVDDCERVDVYVYRWRGGDTGMGVARTVWTNSEFTLDISNTRSKTRVNRNAPPYALFNGCDTNIFHAYLCAPTTHRPPSVATSSRRRAMASIASASTMASRLESSARLSKLATAEKTFVGGRWRAIASRR